MTTQTDYNLGGIDKHFEAFKREKEFLENCSPYTSLTYRTAWNRYRKS